jgi:hypothetical protein
MGFNYTKNFFKGRKSALGIKYVSGLIPNFCPKPIFTVVDIVLSVSFAKMCARIAYKSSYKVSVFTVHFQPKLKCVDKFSQHCMP